tara:strand:+ start:73 stop:342 length:270 start_codon:yes stop_codon:yes gene_type:complete
MVEIYFKNNRGELNLLRKYQLSKYYKWRKTDLQEKKYYFTNGNVTFYKKGQSCFIKTTNFGPFRLYKYIPGSTGCYSEVDKDHFCSKVI